MLMATPAMSWLPLSEMAAAPCRLAVATETAMPASRPSQAEPVSAATVAAPKAAASILPSSPMSKTPARSE